MNIALIWQNQWKNWIPVKRNMLTIITSQPFLPSWSGWLVVHIVLRRTQSLLWRKKEQDSSYESKNISNFPSAKQIEVTLHPESAPSRAMQDFSEVRGNRELFSSRLVPSTTRPAASYCAVTGMGRSLLQRVLRCHDTRAKGRGAALASNGLLTAHRDEKAIRLHVGNNLLSTKFAIRG